MKKKEKNSEKSVNLKGRDRIFYIDNIRIFLTIMVIVHHASCTFGGEGGWFLKEPVPPGSATMILLTMFNAINQSYFMGFFFLLAGYFIPISVDRKGISGYSKERLIRLGIPLVFFFFVVYPLIKYLINLFSSVPLTFMEYIRIEAALFGLGPLWFVQALLIFSAVYLVLRKMTEPGAAGVTARPSPGLGAILFFIVTMGIISSIVRIWIPVGTRVLSMQLAHFTQYIFMFVMGTFLYRYNWIEAISKMQGKFWPGVVLCCIAGLPVMFLAGGRGDPSLFMGGGSWQSFAYSMWESVMIVAVCISLLAFFKKNMNRQNSLSKNMAENAYTVYIVHALILVSVSLFVREFPIASLLKWIIASGTSVIICFGVSHLVRKIPAMRKVLG
ncbi:MAG: acyltransferase family protein [bacterium]|nr:acyltransferase family protein [bacterium]